MIKLVSVVLLIALAAGLLLFLFTPSKREEGQRLPEAPLAPMPVNPMALSRQLVAEATATGRTVEISVTLDYATPEDPVLALALVEHLPKGWTYETVLEGDKPNLVPATGSTDPVEFVWFNVPHFPATFTYLVKAPAQVDGAPEISGQIVYRTSGPELSSEVISTPLMSTSPTATGA